ncbi:hypothetical protein DH2020_045527 [Rehmannia glutinosa]|uniref:ELMO domain-containing protein n=1 Tax=Rehmannia glutinosa TaxID=99300 RepID=A0ABR0UF04_REHGL
MCITTFTCFSVDLKGEITVPDLVAGSAAWLGKGLSCVCAQRRDSDARPSFDLTPAQVIFCWGELFEFQVSIAFKCNSHMWTSSDAEECLEKLQNRLDVAYDSTIPEHQEALWALWHAAFPGEELQGSSSKQEGDRALWEYPFAVGGVNITFMLIQMLDLEAVKPRTLVGATFLKFLAENESAFDLLYCITFKLMDHLWLSMHASYMDFNAVMKATRRQLESELLQEDIMRLEDLPSYSLLSR